MQALVLTAPSRLEVLPMPDPVPAEDEVLLRIHACGICGSDIHGWDGSTGRRRPPLWRFTRFTRHHRWMGGGESWLAATENSFAGFGLILSEECALRVKAASLQTVPAEFRK